MVAQYGVARSWVYELLARWRLEGEAAFEPRSRRPKTSPRATAAVTAELVLRLRKELVEAGLDAGADTIGWHMQHHHQTTVSRAAIHRVLTRAGAVVPEPGKRPKSSYLRFAADQPNECWQSDFTHYRFTLPHGSPGADVEIITWLDDHSRYAFHVTGHAWITGSIMTVTFRETVAQHGVPASTLTHSGMVYTTRLSAGKGGRKGLETGPGRLNIVQKNSRPNHLTTCGKAERFQQTMKKWLRAQPVQPGTLTQLQALLDNFVDQYNHRRPHRSLPRRAVPPSRPTEPPQRPPATAAREPDPASTGPARFTTGAAPTAFMEPAWSPCG
ncbi:integrase core domain-containing protein [Kribbella sp. NPDC004536]|uniref:integrase core domain-containing protein n=1 Tax=Kribbella sp. NPDC004536 TaxID=3364106 RepID=UPI0036C40E0B